MVLIGILISAILTSSVIPFSVLQALAPLSHYLHELCNWRVDLIGLSHPASTEAAKALICGTNLSLLSVKSTFSETGLIHLLVVSGAHLVFIKKLLRLLNVKSTALTLTLLFIYSLVCDLNPPLVRSFLFVCISAYHHKMKIYWPSHYSLLVTGLLCLALDPNWVGSISLQLSWLAALALYLASDIRFLSHNKLVAASPFYILLIPFYVSLGFPEVAILTVGFVFNPILEFLLFPLALIAFLFSQVGFVFEYLFAGVLKILNSLEFTLHITDLVISGQSLKLINWGLILILHVLIHLKYHRKHYVQN